MPVPAPSPDVVVEVMSATPVCCSVVAAVDPAPLDERPNVPPGRSPDGVPPSSHPSGSRKVLGDCWVALVDVVPPAVASEPDAPAA